MKSISKGLSTLSIAAVGFFLAFTGVAQFSKVQAQEATIGNSIVFGNEQSAIEVYVITDWVCPACRSLEPLFTKVSPEVMKVAKLRFIDYPIHDESLNFIPFNLSFMIHDKDKYFALRDALTAISAKTSEPSEEEVMKAIQPLGVKYQQLNYADVAIGIKYFKHMAKEFGVTATPTVVVVNKNDKRGKKLVGGNEITEANIIDAIKTLSNKPAAAPSPSK